MPPLSAVVPVLEATLVAVAVSVMPVLGKIIRRQDKAVDSLANQVSKIFSKVDKSVFVELYLPLPQIRHKYRARVIERR